MKALNAVLRLRTSFPEGREAYVSWRLSDVTFRRSGSACECSKYVRCLHTCRPCLRAPAGPRVSSAIFIPFTSAIATSHLFLSDSRDMTRMPGCKRRHAGIGGGAAMQARAR
jgi:hypothetical protein